MTQILVPFAIDEQTNRVFPQVESMGPDYPWDAPDSVRRMATFAPLAVRPRLDSFTLDPRTRATDVLSQRHVASAGLLASTRFCDLIARHAVHPHERLPATVVFRTRRLPYEWLQLTEPLEPRLDYARSTFVVRRDDGESPITFASDSALRATCRELVDTLSGELLLREATWLPGVQRLDVFALLLTSLTWFVEDAVAAKLRDAGLTGFQLRPTDAVVRVAGAAG